MTYRPSLLLAGAMLVSNAASAQTAQNTFGLGQIETVTVAAERQSATMSTSAITNDQAYTYHATSLNQTLDMMPGVTASNSGGSRNEQLIFVHGFDRLQTPLSIDGIRVYLPADNRLDFGRFLTAGLSQIQVAKGYISVLNGPGALGGAINLVTKKPAAEFEMDARSGLVLGNSGSLDSEDASMSLGTNQGDYYLQGSVSWTQQQRFELSDAYRPTATQPAGFRRNSRARDLNVNLKAGYTPNTTDEYSISYILGTGSKDAPFAVSDPVSTQRNWTWPYWDVSSVYFLSTTALPALGDSAYVKTRAYYNTFDNGLNAYDDATFTTQTKPKAFISTYNDHAYGGNIELGGEILPRNILKASAFYRRDSHDEVQQIFSPAFLEPHQVSVEDTYSIAMENTWHATDRLDVVAGLSYDWRHLLKAEDFIDPAAAGQSGTFIHYPLADGHAVNGQAALIWNATETSSYYANVSDRTRFPTLTERFSTRFGTAASNPGLKAERAANFEIGTKQVVHGWQTEGALFYSDVSNVIQSVILPSPPAPANTTQSQNVGHGAFYGMELSLTGALAPDLTLGANYTWQIRHISSPGTVAPQQLTGNPMYKGFVYLDWQALPDFTITPNLSLASNRWTSNTAGTAYFKTGAYALLGLTMNYRLAERFDINFGLKNLTDQNYELVAGFPEAGRTAFLQLRFQQ